MDDIQEQLVAEAARLAQLPQNLMCADCDSQNLEWASINLGLLLCIQCAGVHRNLGVHISKVRSLTLDQDCWDRNQIDFMYAVGNDRARQIYEATAPCWYLRPTTKINSSIIRENWIRAKYERREFFQDVKHPLSVSLVPEPPKTGFLFKQNKKGVWQKRYVMIFGRYLYYYKEPSQSYPSGHVDLCTVDFNLPNSMDLNKRYVFVLETSTRNYPFAVEIQSEVFEWVHALRRSAAYYLTLLSLDPTSTASNPPTSPEVIKLSYSQIQTDMLHRGFCSKQGGSFKTWNTRLMFVTSTALYYFKKDKPADGDLPEGGIPLLNSFIIKDTSVKLQIGIITPGRNYFIQCNSEQDKADWLSILTSIVDKLNPQRLVDFSNMPQPLPIQTTTHQDGNDSD